jgi:hypothetical protein
LGSPVDFIDMDEDEDEEEDDDQNDDNLQNPYLQHKIITHKRDAVTEPENSYKPTPIHSEILPNDEEEEDEDVKSL